MPKSKALPTTTRCPACDQDNALTVYHDFAGNGQWFYCRHCVLSGEIIELACKVWGCSMEVAMTRLASVGAIDASAIKSSKPFDVNGAADQVNRLIKARRRLTDLWQAAGKRLPEMINTDATIARLCNRYGIRLDASPQRWASGPVQLLGAAHVTAIGRAFFPHVPESRRSKKHQVFTGRGWDEVLMVPYQDMPGRVVGFAFLGRNGERLHDEVYRYVGNSSDQAARGYRDAGLACLNSVNLSSQGPVLAVDDWVLAMRMHFRQFRSSAQPLPIVAWRDDSSRMGGLRTGPGSWSALAGRQVVFWSTKLTPAVLGQAAAADASIAVYTGTLGMLPATDAKLTTFLYKRPVSDLYHALCQHARPWREVWRKWLSEALDGAVDSFLLALDRIGYDSSQLLRQADIRNLNVPTLTRVSPAVNVRGNRVIEVGDTWQSSKLNAIGKSKQQRIVTYEICNAVLRITHAIKDRDSGKMFYYGRIRHRGRLVPFMAPLEMLRDGDVVAFMSEALSEAGLGVLAVDSGFRQHLHQAAILFHEPRFVVDAAWKWAAKVRDERAEVVEPTVVEGDETNDETEEIPDEQHAQAEPGGALDCGSCGCGDGPHGEGDDID